MRFYEAFRELVKADLDVMRQHGFKVSSSVTRRWEYSTAKLVAKRGGLIGIHRLV